MDLKKIGILLIFVGIFLTILFLDSKFFVTALTVENKKSLMTNWKKMLDLLFSL